jgi:hypothetical protein
MFETTNQYATSSLYDDSITFFPSPGGCSSLHLAALTDCPSRLIPSHLPGVHSDGPCRPVRWIFTKRVNNTPAHKQIGS